MMMKWGKKEEKENVTVSCYYVCGSRAQQLANSIVLQRLASAAFIIICLTKSMVDT